MAQVIKLSGDRYEVTANVGPKPFRKDWERTWVLQGEEARSLLRVLGIVLAMEEQR